MLKEVSKLEGYGSEIFAGRWINANNCTCLVSVNPQGVTLSNPENNQCLRLRFDLRNSTLIHSALNIVGQRFINIFNNNDLMIYFIYLNRLFRAMYFRSLDSC